MTDDRSPLLAAFRARWVSGAYPLVVDHDARGEERICAAPSLWMGARQVAEELRVRGVGPSARVALCPGGIGFVQGLVATMRVGATIVLAGPAQVVVRRDLSVGEFDGDPELAVQEVSAALLRRWVPPSAPAVAPETLVISRGPWSTPDLVARVLHALLAGAELHWFEATLEPPSPRPVARLGRLDDPGLDTLPEIPGLHSA